MLRVGFLGIPTRVSVEYDRDDRGDEMGNVCSGHGFLLEGGRLEGSVEVSLTVKLPTSESHECPCQHLWLTSLTP